MDKLTEYALTHRGDKAAPSATPTATATAMFWVIMRGMCRNCNHSIMSVVGADGRILPWWHRVTGLERCEGWSSR